MEDKPIKDFNSPEYKSRCMEWALSSFNYSITGSSKTPDAIIEAAKKYYAYVYGDDK